MNDARFNEACRMEFDKLFEFDSEFFDQILLRLKVKFCLAVIKAIVGLAIAGSAGGCLSRSAANVDDAITKSDLAPAVVIVARALVGMERPTLPNDLPEDGRRNRGNTGNAGNTGNVGSTRSVPPPEAQEGLSDSGGTSSSVDEAAAGEEKPVATITAYTTRYCGACQQAKREIERSGYRGLKFDWREAPDGTVPRFEWAFSREGGQTQRWHLTGWPGLARFVEAFNRTARQSASVQGLPAQSAGSTAQSRPLRFSEEQWGPYVDWKGDLRRHLIEHHGLSAETVNSWSDGQCVGWHHSWHMAHPESTGVRH